MITLTHHLETDHYRVKTFFLLAQPRDVIHGTLLNKLVAVLLQSNSNVINFYCFFTTHYVVACLIRFACRSTLDNFRSESLAFLRISNSLPFLPPFFDRYLKILNESGGSKKSQKNSRDFIKKTQFTRIRLTKWLTWSLFSDSHFSWSLF